MEEDSYRRSRLCRLLGNPVAYVVVQLLAENNELNPSEIARAVGRSVQRVSTVLGALRLAEVVRYDTDGKRNRYRLKQTPKRSPQRSRLAIPLREAGVCGEQREIESGCPIPRFRNSGIMEVRQ